MTTILKNTAMKKLGFLLLCFIGSVTLMAQTIDFEKTLHDYGNINEDDGVAYYEFTFTNNGDAPLIIRNVTTSCGCTVPDWPKAPIAPKEKGKIKVGYNAAGRPNAFSKTITVASNAQTPAVILQIKGFVKPHVKTIEEIFVIRIGDVWFNKSNLSFGRILLNKNVTDTLKYINKGLIETRITVADRFNFMDIKIVPEVVKPNEFGNIIVTYLPNQRNDWGFVNDRFTLIINGQPASSNPISVSGSIEEDFSALTPEQVEQSAKVEFNTTVYDFGETHPEGTPVEFEFVIKNSGKGDLIIRKVKASCGCTTADPSKTVLKTNETSTIKASFRTNGYSGKQNKSITLITNDPKRPTTILRLTGTVVKAQQ